MMDFKSHYNHSTHVHAANVFRYGLCQAQWKIQSREYYLSIFLKAKMQTPEEQLPEAELKKTFIHILHGSGTFEISNPV